MTLKQLILRLALFGLVCPAVWVVLIAILFEVRELRASTGKAPAC